MLGDDGFRTDQREAGPPTLEGARLRNYFRLIMSRVVRVGSVMHHVGGLHFVVVFFAVLCSVVAHPLYCILQGSPNVAGDALTYTVFARASSLQSRIVYHTPGATR